MRPVQHQDLREQMMGARQNNRLWLLGGVVAIVVIVVATFLLAIKPIYTEKSDLQSQSADQDLQLVELKHQLSDLQAKAKNIATYEAQLKVKQAALPENYDLPAYLRSLQTSEKSVTVSVNAVGVSAAQVITGSTTVYSVPITLTVTGPPANISKVLKQFQTAQTRAVLITSVDLNIASSTSATANIVLNAFCRKSETCKVAS
ncbi:type 4a pilus biogenesis protein PilO [Actinoplanes sp. NPDC026619]|uniref:type 4a pilus biogenesis protein PilO n=1 Tax=Actinoplanes sp. NPDC026619 TaxID=3155798 RepID=UPI0033DD684E